MTLLSDKDILAKIYKGEFSITPFVSEHVSPSSIDLTLSGSFKIPRKATVIRPPYHKDDIERYFDPLESETGVVLEPGQMVLAQIGETITLSSNIAGIVLNRNSIIRLGVDVGLSSYINPGYSGQLPIVIKNIGPFSVELVANMRICQLLLLETGRVHRSYGERSDAKYQGESDITLSRLSDDAELTDYIHHYGRESDTQKLSDFLENRIKESSSRFFDSLTPEQKRELGI